MANIYKASITSSDTLPTNLTVSGFNGTGPYTTLTSSTISGSSYSWANPVTSTNFTSSNNKTVMSIPAGEEKMVLEEHATLEVNGTMVLNGLNLDDRLKTIEQVLQIPSRDVTMESKHPRLKALYEAYMHELEKYKTWDRLNGDKNGTT